ncbi:MAG: DNA adenine methylase [Magnetococcales bacterium]|nr:DNA adenine methylase [Magnetococcales bacterium]
MRYPSPLRYPGGKGSFSRFLTDVVDMNNLRGCVYYEPFAGGAGAAIDLLQTGVVTRLHLNDADVRIHAFWDALLTQPESFIERIQTIPLDMDEWQRQHTICENHQNYSPFDIGFAAFYMNRCNRSGVLSQAGPIGGYAQQGNWRLGARFHRDNLSTRIQAIARLRDRIALTGMDALSFLKAYLPKGVARSRALVYLDPPYVSNSRRLYLNKYCKNDHTTLARYLLRQKTLPWILSYDDNDLIRKLYNTCRRAILPIRYSLQTKRSTIELVISPKHISLPSTFRQGSSPSLLLQALPQGEAP